MFIGVDVYQVDLRLLALWPTYVDVKTIMEGENIIIKKKNEVVKIKT